MEPKVLVLERANYSFMRVKTTHDIELELSDYLTFEVPGAQYMPLVRAGRWDGKTRLYNRRYRSTYTGLVQRIERWAKAKGYQCLVDEALRDTNPAMIAFEFERHMVAWMPAHLALRQYQSDAVQHAYEQKRCILISPTGSGKSLIIYLLARFFEQEPTLIVVPTISLVKQFKAMLKEYGYPHAIHTISEGTTKDVGDAKLVIATWQSIYKLKSEWFNYFNTIIGDEVHTFKAKSLATMMEKCTTVQHRIGLTGTLDGAPVNEWLLEGLFGPIKTITETSTLIADGTLAAVTVKQVVLKHPKTTLPRGYAYRDELNYLAENKARNRFIRRLALSLQENTLILFTLVERHGKPLFDEISASGKETKKTVFVYGGTTSWQRELVREISAKEKNVIIVASYGVFSTGIDITHIHNIIFASPSKSRIRVLQSIGRGVRKAVDKLSCTIYDIADAIPGTGRKTGNYTLDHAKTRSAYYANERFPLEQYVVNL